MKKILALLLAAVMVFALVACATSEKPAETKPAETAAETKAEEKTDETPADAEVTKEGGYHALQRILHCSVLRGVRSVRSCRR